MEKAEKSKPTKSNLSKKEWVAINQMQNDPDLIIIPADKGDRTINLNYGKANEEQESIEDILHSGPSVVEIKSYLQKMKERIANHEKLQIDPAPRHEKKLNGVLSRMKRLNLHNGKESKKIDQPMLLARANLERFKTEGAVAHSSKDS